MSRPRKIIPPIKGGFAKILTAIADGKGYEKPKPKDKTKKPVDNGS